MANSYKLKLYTSKFFTKKHSGYVLEEYDSNGRLLHKYYIDPNFKGGLSDLGKLFFHMGMDLNDVPYNESDTKLITNNSQLALDIYNKMAIEAAIINQHTGPFSYKAITDNCNTATSYLADQHIPGYKGKGSSIFDGMGDGFIGKGGDLTNDTDIENAGKIADDAIADLEALGALPSDKPVVPTKNPDYGEDGPIYMELGNGTAVIVTGEGAVGIKPVGQEEYQTKLDDYIIQCPIFRQPPELCLIPGLQEKFFTASQIQSPLILDLDGDGVETISVENGTYFDHDGNGFAEKTGWAGKDDGLLVRDINGNGQIDDGSELFGNNTLLSNGEKAANGFEALKDLDSNQDGVFNDKDNAWHEVKVWQDKNSNGVVDDGELQGLQEAGVDSINLNYSNQDVCDDNGNQHSQNGSYVDSENNNKNLNDVWFEVNTAVSKDKTDIEIPDDILALPNVAGFGNVHDLHTAMALDESGELKALVEKFIASKSYAERQSLILDIIYTWTGVYNVDVDSRGGYIGDARKLEALEEFLGEEYIGTHCGGIKGPNPHSKAFILLIEAFVELQSYIYNELILPGFKDFLSSVTLSWNQTNQEWNVDISNSLEQLRQFYQKNGSEDTESLLMDLANVLKSFGTIGINTIKALKDSVNISSLDPFDELIFAFGDFSCVGTSGNDRIFGTENGDYIIGKNGNDVIHAGNGNDYIDGGDGDDVIYTGHGNNIIIGGAGNDTIYAMEGNYSGTGNNTYYYNRGDGYDIINDRLGNNKLVFGEGISFSDISFKYKMGSLILVLNNDMNQAIQLDTFHEDASIKTLEFLDGTTINLKEIGLLFDHRNDNANASIIATDYDDKIYGSDNNDVIHAQNGNNIICGGEGNDSIYAGNGDDTYIYNLGDGWDKIYDSVGRNTIEFGEGISFDDLSFRQWSTDLIITVKNDSQQGMELQSFYNVSSQDPYLLKFADGSVVNLREIGMTFHQTDNSDLVSGTNFNDIIYGYAGNDTLCGNDGDDLIYGGNGNDNMWGDSGNDLLVGGAGDDSLHGGSGDDRYVYQLGDGFDTITESGGNDTISFGEGITFDDLTFSSEYGGLIMNVKGEVSQGIKIEYFFNTDSYKIENLEFADGSKYVYQNDEYVNANQLIQAMGAFGVDNSTESNFMIEELNIAENPLAASYK